MKATSAFQSSLRNKVSASSKTETLALVPVAINVGVVDIKFDAIVVLEGYFSQCLYLGWQEMRCYSIWVQHSHAHGKSRLEERHNLHGTYSRVWVGSIYFVTKCLSEDCHLMCPQPPTVRHPALHRRLRKYQHHRNRRRC